MCSMSAGTYRRSPAPRTRQTVITQDKVRTEAPCTNGLSFKENALLCCRRFYSSLYLCNIFFFPPWREPRSPPTLFEKKKRSRTPPRYPLPPPPLSNPPGFFQLFGGQPGSLGQSTMVWTENFCYVERRGWGDSLFSLTWQPNESPEC